MIGIILAIGAVLLVCVVAYFESKANQLNEVISMVDDLIKYHHKYNMPLPKNFSCKVLEKMCGGSYLVWIEYSFIIDIDKNTILNEHRNDITHIVNDVYPKRVKNYLNKCYK